MGIDLNLSVLAMRPLIDGACAAVGVIRSGEAVVGFLTERFTDHSQKLMQALQTANEHAWKALEVALAGESFWEKCQVLVARGEHKAFGRQMRAFLDASPVPGLSSRGPEFRQKCLRELRAARKARLLTRANLDARQLAKQAGHFARFADPTQLLDAEWGIVEQAADELRGAGHANLAQLLALRPPEGLPLLVIAARYFFRRQVEEDPKLAQGLAFARMEKLAKAQEQGFAALGAVMAEQGQQLEGLLSEIQAVVVETHEAVLDLQSRLTGQGEQVRQIGQAVQKLLEQHQLQRRAMRPGDSLSIRNDNERQLVKQLVARYRALPEGERQQAPALLSAVGKLEVVAGDFDAAQKDFQAVALMEPNDKGQAEAHYHAYLASLEKRDWPEAIQELARAVKLDARRFAPFPVGKYQPIRILGAGGFGVAFLCKHKHMNAQVVVKTLILEDLDRDPTQVFTEAHMVRQLDHPAIIRISDCGFVNAADNSRPFLVMDYFPPGTTLEEHVKEHGPLAPDDLVAVAQQAAEGLHAAHGKNILHRDVKPANLLVRKDKGGWKVKLIDFGLALKQQVIKTTMNASTAKRNKTLVGESIAGTVDYAAPEQMGRREGEPVGPYSDVYGWAKTCCYALFQTTQPTLRHWQGLPEPLAELLGRCLEEDPRKRPSNFAEILASLRALKGKAGRESFAAPVRTKTASGRPGPRPAGNGKSSRGRLPLLLGGGVVLAVLLVGILLGGFVLRTKTKAGTLVVEVDQLGAEVFIDGQRYTITRPGEEPVVVEVQEGTRQLKVVRGGFETFTREFKVKAGEKETIRVRLEPLPLEKSKDPVETGDLRCFLGHSLVQDVAFDPQGRRAVSGSALEDKTVRVWDLETGKEIHRLVGHTGNVQCVCFTPDGRGVLSGSGDKTLRLWDAASGKEIGQFPGLAEGVEYYMRVSPDGKRLVASSYDKIVHIWDFETKTEIKQFGFRGSVKEDVWIAAFSADGRRAISGGLDDAVRLWDVDQGKFLRVLDTHSRGGAFSLDGRFVATTGLDRQLRLYEVESGKLVRSFQEGPAVVHNVSFSPDGRRILTSYENKDYAGLWDVTKGVEIHRLKGNPGGVGRIVFSPDGTRALSGGRDGSVRLWELPK
jgi:tetratricopeptide (TPR) repeat protein